MRVTNARGLTVELLVGPEHGATKIYVWCVAAPSGQTVGMHHHNGEELIRVLYGQLHMRVEDAARVLGPGEVVILPPGTRHGYRALEDSEIEVYGEIGSGEFLTISQSDGSTRVEEVFQEGAPWSRTPDDPAKYMTHTELLARYEESLANDPLG
jgi:quercetin dioxygenase-like cupin family protein